MIASQIRLWTVEERIRLSRRNFLKVDDAIASLAFPTIEIQFPQLLFP